MREKKFRTVEDILSAFDRSLRIIQRLGSSNGSERLPHRWELAVHNTGDYIEGFLNLQSCMYLSCL
ncbi:hypothetical protein C0J52_22389 [Blattella germanica]|nr:hypothetical protein C0J52_22389 [Blattella germanica]